MALGEQHINDLELIHVSMALELLTDLGSDGRHGDVQRVHCLDLGRLFNHPSVSEIVPRAFVLRFDGGRRAP